MCIERTSCRGRQSDEDYWRLGVYAYLGIGSNLGDRKAWCAKAIARLITHPDISLLTRSALYETEPVDAPNQEWFLNCVVSIETELTVHALFALCTYVERELGRIRSWRNHPRTIDIDVLFYGTEVVNTSELTVPHPRVEARGFVLVPLAEIAPDLLHPLLQLTIRELRDRLEASPIVRKLDDM